MRGGAKSSLYILDDLIDYIQPTLYRIKDDCYSKEFKTPVLTAGKTFILGYTNENNNIYQGSKDPVIIFDDFTTAIQWVDFNFKVKSSAMKILKTKNHEKTNLKYLYHWMKFKNFRVDFGSHERHWISKYSQFQIHLPSIEEQNRIVSSLDKFENLVNNISIGIPAEIKYRHQQYEYYRNQLLSFEELHE